MPVSYRFSSSIVFAFAIVVALIPSRVSAGENALFLPFEDSVVTLFNAFAEEQQRIAWRDAGSSVLVLAERLPGSISNERFFRNRTRVDPSHPEFDTLAIPKLEEERTRLEQADLIDVWLWTQLYATDNGVQARLTISRHPFKHEAPTEEANVAFVVDDFDDYLGWSMSEADRLYLVRAAPEGFVDINMAVRLTHTGFVSIDGVEFNAIFASVEGVTFTTSSAVLMRCVRRGDDDHCARLD